MQDYMFLLLNYSEGNVVVSIMILSQNKLGSSGAVLLNSLTFTFLGNPFFRLHVLLIRSFNM